MSDQPVEAAGERRPSPFADLISAVAWLAVAVAIVVLSWRMDRLAHLQISIYAAPGFVPGVLGAALALMAAVLFVRTIRQGALADARWPALGLRPHWRLLVVLGLSLAFAAGVVGSGVPFWLAAALYTAAFVFVFRIADGGGGEAMMRAAAVAVVHGAVSGVIIHYVFQELFLVRLP
jgi:Tripartite tricarboxylate transporter TctB family